MDIFNGLQDKKGKRMITNNEIKALEDIVGEKWVSVDPCTMDAYSFYMNPEALNKEGGRFTPRPTAVVLPESTQQISEIMKFCNESGLMAKPFSTGFCIMGAPSRDRVITLDLKRMNKIIEIDVKNQIAVIEPYVRAIDLQTRLMGMGLNCHVVSAGGGHSLLASATSAWGTGVNGPSMGYSARNLLGAEWVLPTGEVVQLGSSGNKAGWFSPDGPGPAMHGVMRGYQGAFGGLGVFTKCAIKLYRWDGPAECEVKGSNPNYYITKVPENIALNGIAFPSSDAMREAGYLMGEADIEYAQFRTPMFFVTLGMTKNNEDLKAILETGVFQKIGKHVLVNAVIGYSKREFKWKMKTLRQILKETGGVLLPTRAGAPDPKLLKFVGKFIKYMKDPLWILRKFPILQQVMNGLLAWSPWHKKAGMEAISKAWWVLVRHANNVQGTLRASQALSTTLGSMDTWDVGIAQADWMAERKKETIATGLIVDDEMDLGCGGTFEGGHMGYLEAIVLYSTKNPDSLKAADELVAAGAEASIKHHFGVPIAGFGTETNKILGPECHNYHLWMAKIKKALDPNTASDPRFYSEPEES